jgi:toxin ParE1/3/4
MQIRWSPAAAEDLSRIFEYIRPENPSAAQRVVKTIYESAGSLESFPYCGRVGRVDGTRELALAFASLRSGLSSARGGC